jgi:hypothetical protein
MNHGYLDASATILSALARSPSHSRRVAGSGAGIGQYGQAGGHPVGRLAAPTDRPPKRPGPAAGRRKTEAPVARREAEAPAVRREAEAPVARREAEAPAVRREAEAPVARRKTEAPAVREAAAVRARPRPVRAGVGAADPGGGTAGIARADRIAWSIHAQGQVQAPRIAPLPRPCRPHALVNAFTRFSGRYLLCWLA